MRTATTAAVYSRLHNSSVGAGVGGGGVGVGVVGVSIVAGSNGGSGVMHHSQLARSLERILEEAHYSGELNLANRKLKDFPKMCTKFSLMDTVIADLSRNRFCELPEDITTFSFLETLLLYHNTIRSMPESVKHLTSLTYLDLRNNQLSLLPRELCFLPLQVLLVSNNRLGALPDELGRMDRLTDLDVSYNQLATLPARIGELHSLRSLSLRSNQLMYLPRELTCLMLVSLDVSGNRIASLPLELRQMSTLVEFNVENNPLTSPPASLCVRGLVHVFKFLETQATKEEKGSRAGGNYDGYTTLRRAARYNGGGTVIESNRVPRHPVDSGYSTCDGIDKRWSHDVPFGKSKCESPARKLAVTPPSSLSSEPMDASLTSSSSTIVDESTSSLTLTTTSATAAVVAEAKPIPLDGVGSPLHHRLNYAHSNSSSNSSTSSPEQEDEQQQQQQSPINGGGSKLDEKLQKNLGNIQTYREYKEALKQQRNQEISSVYKMKEHGQKQHLGDMGEVQRNHDHEAMPKSIMKAALNGLNGGNAAMDDCIIPKKPIQKVIPSRHSEAAAKPQTNGDNMQPPQQQHVNGDCLGYVKPNSPMKMGNGAIGGILTNNNKFSTAGGNGVGTSSGTSSGRSPVTTNANKLSTAKPHRTVTWNHDIPAEKLSFTMRREFDRQREETELMTQLRIIIETRLKMTLPEDIASALTDGVILCHLANYVRPRSVASIHVPSPGVSKLTMARCRRNVDNFLEACRKIGVDEELICSCADVVPSTPIAAPLPLPTTNATHYALCHNNNNNNVNATASCDSKNNNNNNNNYNSQNYNNNEFENAPSMGATADAANLVDRKATLPNVPAVIETVLSLIALDANPQHQSTRNAQQQQELQQKLKDYLHKRNRIADDIVDDAYDVDDPPQYSNVTAGGSCDHGDDGSANDDEKQLLLMLQRRHAQEQEQSTAIGTSEQMIATRSVLMSMRSQHGVEARGGGGGVLVEQQATIKCHFDSGATQTHMLPPAIEAASVDGREASDCQQQLQQRRSPTKTHKQRLTNVSRFLRHAKLKTLQRIKLNLHSTAAHRGGGALCGSSGSGAENLQTIVEAESDVGTAAGVFHLINEKPFGERETSPTPASSRQPSDISGSDVVVNKYKLLELPKCKEDVAPQKSSSISKRIEFFEHTHSVPAFGASGLGPPPMAAVKPTKANNVFSIYRVADMPADAGVAAGRSAKIAVAQREAGSSLLRHDSHVLTMILSGVFIVTFLLLVFFPLPG